MAASHWTWAAALGSLIVVLALAVSAAGLLPTISSASSSTTSAAPAPNWGHPGPTYAVNFTETGLPNGTSWYVVVHAGWGSGRFFGGGGLGWFGITGNWSTTSSVGFQLANGTYDYSVGSFPSNGSVYAASPSAGNFTVNGTGVGVSVAFSLVTFSTVSFTETGLPNGTFWSVHLAGAYPSPWTPFQPGGRGGWGGSNGSTVNLSVPNGNYSYRIGLVSSAGVTYVATPASGNVVVNGSNVSVAVTFAPLTYYNVTFTETGLPNGTYWSVALGGSWSGGQGAFTNATTITRSLTNGTYAYSVPSVWTPSGVYGASPSSGTVTVNGSAVSVAISFAPLTFSTVSFVETGLPNGTFWSVSLLGAGWGGFAWNGSAGTAVNFTVANGTYPFSIGQVWTSTGLYAATPASGNVTVNGSAVTVDVSFTSVPLYNVSFVESGLPNGTRWSAVAYGNGTFAGAASTTTTLNLSLPNGTYTFTLGWAWSAGTLYSPSPASGTIAVSGAATSVNVTYS